MRCFTFVTFMLHLSHLWALLTIIVLWQWYICLINWKTCHITFFFFKPIHLSWPKQYQVHGSRQVQIIRYQTQAENTATNAWHFPHKSTLKEIMKIFEVTYLMSRRLMQFTWSHSLLCLLCICCTYGTGSGTCVATKTGVELGVAAFFQHNRCNSIKKTQNYMLISNQMSINIKLL